MAHSNSQQPNVSVVQAAARLAFAQAPAKQRVVNQLLLQARNSHQDLSAAQISLEDAAQSAWVHAKDLLHQLKADPCFRIHQQNTSCCVSLNSANILSQARGATTTGILTEELPPPTGFVDGKLPIRPGQPNCTYYMKFGSCAYKDRCVYNHPGKPSSGAQQTQQPRKQQPAGSAAAAAPTPAPKAPAPPPKQPAWGGAGVQAAASKPPGGPGGADVSTQPAGAAGGDPMQAASTSSRSSVQGASGTTKDILQAADQHAQPQQQQQAVVATAGPLPPGFSAQHFKSRPCHMLAMRGFCPMGDKCPFDHNTPAGSRTSDQAASNSTSHPDPVASTGAASAQQPTTGDPAAAAGAGELPQRSWRQLLAGPQAAQQAEHSQAAGAAASQAHPPPPPTPPPPAAPAAGGSTGGIDGEAAASKDVGADRADKLLGWTEGNLPQLRGEPSCPFFMGIGTCKFRERCIYHHPTGAEHPACILRGELPRRYNASTSRPSYGRLVNHLYRLWDYDSCVEAQLKIWLAKHLLSRNNPEAHMFSSTASQPAISTKGRGFYWQSLGPYTCSMGEAGEVLHHMWRAQPGEASRQPMPYTKMLRELLLGDAYFSMVQDSKCSSHWWVRLDVEKIVSMLNF